MWRRAGRGRRWCRSFIRRWCAGLDLPQPVAVLNIGGVANVTVLEAGADPIACDTGPGNALLDDFMAERTGRPYDDDGASARRGQVDEAAVAEVLAHPFFAAPPPKSLDRNEFRAFVAERLHLTGASTEDGAATLTALTAASIAAVVGLLPKAPKSWIVAGGGARNSTLRAMLAERLGVPVLVAEQVGWSADALEAHAFGFLAVRSLKGLALTYPTTTGVRAPDGRRAVPAPSLKRETPRPRRDAAFRQTIEAGRLRRRCPCGCRAGACPDRCRRRPSVPRSCRRRSGSRRG